MKHQPFYGVGLCALFAFLISATLAWPAHAAVTVRSVIGDAQVSVDGQSWAALTQDMSIQAGYRVRTDVGSNVVIQAEDGSVFDIQELSELKFNALTFSRTVRVYHIELLQGRVNGDVPFFQPEGDNDVVQITTTVAIADATTIDNRPTSFQVFTDPSIPLSELYNFNGFITLRKIAKGATNFVGLFGSGDATSREGLALPVKQIGAFVDMDVQAKLATIIVKSTHGIEKLTAMLGDYMGMEVTNIDEKNQAPITLFMPDGEHVLTLDKKGQKVSVATLPVNVILGKAPVYLHGKFEFFYKFDATWDYDWCDGDLTSGAPEPGAVLTPWPVPPSPPDHEPSGSPILPRRP